MSQPLLIEQEEEFLLLTLNRPESRNALNLELLENLKATIESAASQNVRAIVFRGAGKVFCAGLDLAQTADHPHEAAQAVKDLFLTIANCPLITVSLVHGAAVAGGAGIATICDFCFITQDAKIGFPEVRRGLVPALVSAFLRRQLRERDLRELMLTGDLIDAKRAREFGLVNEVVPNADQLLPAAHHLISRVTQAGPNALALTKKLLLDLLPHSPAEDAAKALHIHNDARNSPEAREGSQAFFEKRTPSWVASSKSIA